MREHIGSETAGCGKLSETQILAIFVQNRDVLVLAENFPKFTEVLLYISHAVVFLLKTFVIPCMCLKAGWLVNYASCAAIG